MNSMMTGTRRSGLAPSAWQRARLSIVAEVDNCQIPLWRTSDPYGHAGRHDLQDEEKANAVPGEVRLLHEDQERVPVAAQRRLKDHACRYSALKAILLERGQSGEEGLADEGVGGGRVG